jgi:hypothetical protein
VLAELRIREAQMKVFAGVYENGFRLRAAAWLRETFPDQCAGFGDGEIAAIVATAFEQASRHGLTREVDILRWLNLMLALGFDFHRNPDLPWVREVLQDTGAHPDAIASWLTDRALRHLKAELRG